MAFEQTVGMLRQQLDSKSRSDALRPLAWLVGLTGTSLAALAATSAIWPILALVGLCFAGAVVLYGYAYYYFMTKDPDALRSEKYAIHKLAIEKGVYGDDIAGAFTEEQLVAPTGAALPSPQDAQTLRMEDDAQ